MLIKRYVGRVMKKRTEDYRKVKARSLLIIGLMLANIQMVQAGVVTYSVEGTFSEPMSLKTDFKGTFNWDGTSLSNLSGRMNSSMYGRYVEDENANHMLTLNQNLIQSIDENGFVTATIFKENTSDVYYGGGYEGVDVSFLKYGFEGRGGAFGILADGNDANENAFFTFAFQTNATGGITSLGLHNVTNNPALVNQMIYGDCSANGLMSGGCMAGEVTATSLMEGTALSLNISQVSAVPVPAAVWLFGTALAGLVGVSRKRILAA